MEHFLRRARLAVNGGLLVIVAGLGGLLVTVWVEYLRHPGVSFADAYWDGREPWTSLSIWIVLGGSILSLLAGVVVALVDGGPLRRVLAVLALLPAGYWWLMAVGFIAGPGAGGAGRPPHNGWDPVSLAFSLPVAAGVLVVLPALLAAALALVSVPERPSSTMAPVHDESPREPPW